MEIQNLLNSVLDNNNKVNSDLLSRLKIGDILKARILSLTGDAIMLEINNKFTIEAKDISIIHYQAGDIVEFMVADKADDKLFIKSNVSQLTILESKLSEMGIKLTEDNKDLIKLLFKNQIPITKENINIILSTKKYYGKLIELIKDNNLPVTSEILNRDVREVLKSLIQSNDFNSSDKTSQQEIRTLLNLNNEANRQGVKTSVKATNNSQDTKALVSGNTNGSVKNIPFVNEFLSGNNRPTLEKLVFMLKNNLNFNVKDTILMDNIIAGKKNITSQIENVIRLLDDDIPVKDSNVKNNNVSYEKSTENENIKNKFLGLLKKLDISAIKEKEKFEPVIKELLKELEDIRTNDMNNETRAAVNRHIEEIKTSFEFMNKLNENMTFMQIPLHINNSLKNLDIYIKKDTKSSKKINPDNAKIFISLNTNNLDLVQVLIELKRKDIYLNFKVSNKKIEKIIRANEKILSDKLKEYDFGNVVFKYSISTEKIELTQLDLSTNESKLNTLDIRV